MVSKQQKRDKLTLALDALLADCDEYHCPGDCGQPHSPSERARIIEGALLDAGIIGPDECVFFGHLTTEQ